jgi:hypothetical protein
VVVSTKTISEDYLLCKPRCSFVIVRNAIYGGYRLSLATTGEQKFWRFVEMEEEESTNEHGKGDCAQCEDEITPTHIVSFRACNTSLAREIRNVCPCNYGWSARVSMRFWGMSSYAEKQSSFQLAKRQRAELTGYQTFEGETPRKVLHQLANYHRHRARCTRRVRMCQSSLDHRQMRDRRRQQGRA